MSDNTAAYNATTEELVAQGQKISQSFDFIVPYDIGDTIRAIRAAFKNPTVRQQILSPRWEAINFEDGRYSAGFCQIVSYIFYHAFRGTHAPNPWIIRYFKDRPTFGSHAWLEYTLTNTVLDLTKDQFDGIADESGNIMDDTYRHRHGKEVFANGQSQLAYKFADLINPELAAIVRKNSQQKT